MSVYLMNLSIITEG